MARGSISRQPLGNALPPNARNVSSSSNERNLNTCLLSDEPSRVKPSSAVALRLTSSISSAYRTAALTSSISRRSDRPFPDVLSFPAAVTTATFKPLGARLFLCCRFGWCRIGLFIPLARPRIVDQPTLTYERSGFQRLQLIASDTKPYSLVFSLDAPTRRDDHNLAVVVIDHVADQSDRCGIGVSGPISAPNTGALLTRNHACPSTSTRRTRILPGQSTSTQATASHDSDHPGSIGR